jgi:hypothetical protein
LPTVLDLDKNVYHVARATRFPVDAPEQKISRQLYRIRNALLAASGTIVFATLIGWQALSIPNNSGKDRICTTTDQLTRQD